MRPPKSPKPRQSARKCVARKSPARFDTRNHLCSWKLRHGRHYTLNQSHRCSTQMPLSNPQNPKIELLNPKAIKSPDLLAPEPPLKAPKNIHLAPNRTPLLNQIPRTTSPKTPQPNPSKPHKTPIQRQFRSPQSPQLKPSKRCC